MKLEGRLPPNYRGRFPLVARPCDGPGPELPFSVRKLKARHRAGGQFGLLWTPSGTNAEAFPVFSALPPGDLPGSTPLAALLAMDRGPGGSRGDGLEG